MTIPSIFTAVLTGLVSFALSYYSQNKSKRDVVNAIFAETKIKFEDNKNRNLLQIKYIVEVIKFIVQSILFAILLMIIYRFLQTINSSSASACIITALIIYGLCYNIFSAILFSIFRLLLLAREIKKKRGNVALLSIYLYNFFFSDYFRYMVGDYILFVL